MKGFFGNIWKGLKFAFSATIGIPCACAATSLLGAAYILAEATNIVEAKVKKNLLGQKEVLKSPFFQSVADGLRSALKTIWKDYGAYSHITLAKLALDKTERQKLFPPIEMEKAEEIKPINSKSMIETAPTPAPIPAILPSPLQTAVSPPATQTAISPSPLPNENKNLPVTELTEPKKPEPPTPPPPVNLNKDIVLPSSSPKATQAETPLVENKQNTPNNVPATA